MTSLVSFLVPDIGAPTIGAALKLARMLEPEYRTEIVGPDFGRGICSLYRDAYPFRPIPAGRLYRLPDFAWESGRIAGAVQGDVVIALKAFATTVGIALKVKKQRGVPVAVYLDEWDAALWYSMSAADKCACWFHHFHHPAEPCYHPLAEKYLRHADVVLSTTTWLQQRFGGDIVHAGVDGHFFKPQPSSQVAALKLALGLAGKKVIVFGGVVRPHKGVEEILEAVLRLDRADVRLLVVGPLTEHLTTMLQSERYGKLLVVAGDPVNAATSRNADIHKQMPLYLDVGDLVVLPLRDTLLARSQMPIKLFEALAMGKPVVGTAVADLPQMLEGCGLVVPPDRVDALSRAIGQILSDDQAAHKLGQAARLKCMRCYDKAVVRSKMLGIVDGLLQGRKKTA
jgi:glycosyltransferase involved in cell wall biosynthesis